MKKNVLHQLESKTQSQMMSYVIETADSRLIVIDGGLRADCNYLLGYIKELTGGYLKIDAWILTHAHSDHIDAFLEAIEKRGNELDIGKIYYNFPPADYIGKYEADEFHTIEEFNTLLPRFADRTVIMHTGDVYKIGALSWKVLWEPDTSIICNVINNASVLIKMDLGGKSILITGDLGVEAGECVLRTCGSELKSDFVEMAHHGQNGVGRSFYEAVAPEVCLWCTPLWLWNNDAGGGYNSYIWKTIEVRRWMEEMGVTRHYIIKDGTARIEL
jgi:beta-lactamase superfamily II metal-dependent hydrolase